MKLVIFIGHFKTGSSSLQSLLSSNFLKLLQAGILYPSVESQGISRNMQTLAAGVDYPSIGQTLNVIEPHNALALKLKTEEDGHGVPLYYPNLPSGFQMLELITNQLCSLQPQAMVLCSEVFALLGMTKKRRSVQRLVDRFATHEVTIYCNLRRPDEYLSSWHRQRLKFGARLEKLSGIGLTEYLNTAHVQQAKMIEGWIKERFCEAKLVVRNFDMVRREGGTISDFIRNSDLPFPTELYIPRDQNPSIPSAFSEVGRLAIRELPQASSSKVIHWLSSVAVRVPHPPDSQVEMLGVNNRKILIDTFRPISRHLDALIGRESFYSNLETFCSCNEISDTEAARQALPELAEDAARQNLPGEILSWIKELKI